MLDLKVQNVAEQSESGYEFELLKRKLELLLKYAVLSPLKRKPMRVRSTQSTDYVNKWLNVKVKKRS